MNIIELAKQAGGYVSSFHGRWVFYAPDIERFAALVRAAALEEAAGVCDEYDGSWYVHRKGAVECAAAIRIRALKEKT